MTFRNLISQPLQLQEKLSQRYFSCDSVELGICSPLQPHNEATATGISSNYIINKQTCNNLFNYVVVVKASLMLS